MAAYLIKINYKDNNDSINDKITRTLSTAVDIIYKGQNEKYEVK